jgi:hypothetical protein
VSLATEPPAPRPGGITWDNWLVRLALAVGALNFVVLFGQLRGMVHALYRNPDTATGLVLAGLDPAHDPARVVTLGNYHYYETWWLETLTRGLPGHWSIWEAMPIVIAFVAIALMAWTAWIAIGPFAAALTTVVMLALGDEMRQILFTPDTHGYVVAHAALLAAALVFLADRAGRQALSWRLLGGVGVALAALSAAGATDQLFEFVALPSFALAGCLGWWRHPGRAGRQIAIFSVAVCCAAILGGQLLDALMRSNLVVASPFPISFVAPTALLSNLQVTVASLAHLGGGSFFGAPVKGVQLLVLAIGLMLLPAAVALARLLWRHFASLGTRHSALTPARELYVTFWGLTVVFSVGAFALTNLPVDAGDARYLPAVFAGAAALLPALAMFRWQRRAVLSGAIALFAMLIAINHLIEGTPASSGGPPPIVAAEVQRFVRAEGADHGYAPYYDAPVMGWQTRGALKVYPVTPCGATLCAFLFNRINTWYGPLPGVRTFLVTDSRTTITTSFSAAPAAFGSPLATTAFGPYTVYVYDHDIAANLG